MLNVSKLSKYVCTYGCAAENTTMNNNSNTKAAHIHELSGVPTTKWAADTASSVPHKIAATDKNNIFLFSVATSDGKVSASSSTPKEFNS